jgi:hypothetical protein
MMISYDKRHSPEAQEWYYRLVNDPEYFERWRYIDTINDYKSIIARFEKLYDQTPTTDRFMRGLKGAKTDLAETRAEYDKFKKYKAKTAISR